MSEYMFPTGASVALFIDGIHLDLAHRIDFKQSKPKYPRYGYNDTIYTRALPGRQLIQGFIAINFIEPNYLLRVLTRNKSNRLDNEFLNNIDTRINELPNFSSDEDKTRRAQYIASFLFPPEIRAEEEGTEVISDKGFEITQAISKVHRTSLESEQFVERLIKKFSTGEIPTKGVKELDADPLKHENFDIDIYYQNPERTTWYTKLVGVDFTEISQTIPSAGADGSSDPIFEIYEFIAKERKLIVRI